VAEADASCREATDGTDTEQRVGKKTRRKEYLNIWSSGRAIQLKMPAGRLKQRYGSMDIPCRSSWTGAHANFQVREYDAGASPETSEPAQKTKDSWAHASTNF
jgi:hypothetical protein